MLDRIISIIMTAVMFVSGGFSQVFAAFKRIDDIAFDIDLSQRGEVLGNKVSNVNVWSVGSLPSAIPQNDEADISGFVEYIQIMQATGGNAQRDLFIDPNDTTVLDDYNFAPLIAACRSIVDFGAKPHIKTGNVPMKFSSGSTAGVFGVNVYPPDDYDVYYSYISAMAQALVDTFGRDEVLSWRFGVFTEYENESWFYEKGKDPEQSMKAFCKIYDYTVDALQSVIGENVFVGAHSMSVAQGLWDERDFIEHVANGTNYKTGKKGTRISFLSSSFYDSEPGKFNSEMTLPQTIAVLRDKAESVGLCDLIYGVDEGRILSGTSGSAAADLNMRICGYTYQAAYDARLIKQMADNDIDYFSSWGYSSGGLFQGYPTVSYHVAKKYSEMAEMTRVKVRRLGVFINTFDDNGFKQRDISALAGVDGEGNVSVMAYNFCNDLDRSHGRDVRLTLRNTAFKDGKVKATFYVVDDDANYFDEWQADREKYNITDDCFTWSPDDPSIDSETTLSAPWARQLYNDTLRDSYRQCAKLHEKTLELEAKNGRVIIDTEIDANTVLFINLTAER